MKIFVTSGYGYWGNFTPDDLNGENVQIGGGETAMISVSREIAALGHDVTVFYDVNPPGRYHGVDYLPAGLFVPLACNQEFDVLVCWDAPHALRFRDRAKVRVLAFQLNDAQIGPFDHMVDLYMHPSQWHIDMFHELYPEMSTFKSVARVTNGIDYNRYVPVVSPDEVRKPRVIYSSSPDRGLHHLLRMWPLVHKEVPEAELHVFYDMKRWLDLDDRVRAEGGLTNTSERAAIIKDQIEHPENLPNVTFHGAVGQGRLAREQAMSKVMAYPCDPVRPTEGFSMSILEGITAGCHVISTNADALPELWSSAPNTTLLPLPVDDGVWVQTIIERLTCTPMEAVMYNQIMSWQHIARRWVTEISRCLNKQ